jgi:RNA polymerase sigma-70 factor (ECF subfamily)
LLERVKLREQRAWEQLVSIFSPLVLRWCRQSGVPAADVEDVGQDVFRNVFRRVGAFRRDQPGESFRAWLRTITVNRSRDHLRALANKPATAEVSDDLKTATDPIARVDEEEERGILMRRVLAYLQAEYAEESWRAFWRVTIQGEAVADVAAQLGITANSIYILKSRVLRQLREHLVELGESGLP